MTIPLWSIAVGTGYVDLNLTNNITVIDVFGAGMPPVRNVATPYGLADGALWQRHSVEDRTVTIVMSASGASMTGLHALRAKLIAAVSPHRSQPVRLWYRRDETSTAKYLDCYYEAGLESGELRGYTEKIGLRLLATEPYWYASTSTSGAVDVRSTLANCNYIAVRSSRGVWSNATRGMNNWVRVLAYGPDNNLYAGGSFTSAGNIAARCVAKWNGSTWSTLAGGLGSSVRALAFDPSGNLYAGGDFSAGADPEYVAKWDGSTWSTLGAGMSNRVNALAIGSDGKLYAGGQFNTAGGNPAARIARWDGAAWSTLGAGMSGIVYALAVGPDGSLYAGGAFTSAGGVTANRVARWNGSTWSALGSGMSYYVQGLVFGPDGNLYAGGQFTTAGGVTANRVARWNGVAWSALGDGVDDGVYGIAVDNANRLHIVGGFDYTGSRILVPCHAVWADPVWLADEVDITVAVYATAVAFADDGSMAIGGQWDAAGLNAIAGQTIINNPGSAAAYPIFTFTGPGRLYNLTNWTTGERIDFNLLLLSGEVVILDLRAGHKTFVSNFRGNIISTILPSDMVNWRLNPGNNAVSCFVNSASASASVKFTPCYWSNDGAPS